jgi:hypothetical protein
MRRVVLAVLFASLALPTSSQAAFPGTNGKIAFDSLREANPQCGIANCNSS